MTDSKKHISTILCVGILLAAAILMIRACSMDLPRLLDRLAVDDTFLYLQIARNVAHGRGPTFDGLHATNGFQPLWLLATLPLAIVFREPESFFRACLYLCAFLNMLTMWVLYGIGFRLGGRTGALSLIGGFLWVLTRWRPFLSGMETSLYLLIFAIFLRELLNDRTSASRLSVFGGLLILCRVDAVIFIIAGFLAFKPSSKQAALRLIIPLILVTAPYFIWNLVSFGSLLPVSGEVKSLYHRQELGADYLQIGHVTKTFSVYLPRAALSIADQFATPFNRICNKRFAPQALWFCFLSLGSVFLMRRGTLVMLSLFGILHLFVMAASIGRFSVSVWYYAPLILLVLIGAAIGISSLHRLFLRSYFPMTILLICCMTWFAMWTGWNSLDPVPEKWDLYQRRYRLAKWLNRHLPSDAIIGSWNSGHLAFFSERTVVNLDGLVNDSNYLRSLEKRRPVMEYIEKENIDYIVDYDTVDLSMHPDKTWNSNKQFRGEIPRRRLKIIRKDPRSGKDPHTLYVFEVRSSGHENAKT